MSQEFDFIRNQTIGTVEFVSPKEIKVLVDPNSPYNTSLNTGMPQPFPRINGYLLIPNEFGALIGLISWIGIEYSPYPKRKGFKDFDLIDLPFPLRKISLTPVGILKKKENEYEIERGIYTYPSVGDPVIIPSDGQLKAIVQNKEKNAKVKIGTAPLAANAPIFVDPDKLFGRHLAILGNTGSGKSCTAAGLIRWSLESAKKELNDNSRTLNSRFIILDPNGEYADSFDDLGGVKKFKVKISDDSVFQQLKVPTWMWNSYEWCSIAQASAKTQRPLLRRALREVKSGTSETNEILINLKRDLTSILITLRSYLNQGISSYANFPGKQNLGEFLESSKNSLGSYQIGDNENGALNSIISSITGILDVRKKNNSGYYPSFEKKDIESIIEKIKEQESVFGKFEIYKGPDEDSPVFFKNDDFISHLERLSQEQNVQQFLDFFLMRVRSILTDERIVSIISTDENEITLQKWLENYIGGNEQQSIVIIDLSLVPSEIIYLTVAVFSRVIFEALQRYRKLNGNILPSVLVMEEAHNFIKRYEIDSDEISSQRLCTQSFEKIAKEGRKFGLGLVISSQRPSELSQTVLSQCNTFILHRIVNDRDQEMVRKLLPDALGSILNELPVLPSQKAIILGWAIPIPLLVEINYLDEKYRPQSKDPDFWDVWTYKEERKVDWKPIVDEWQNKKTKEV